MTMIFFAAIGVLAIVGGIVDEIQQWRVRRRGNP